MKFSKKGNIYKIIRITGSQDNILGVMFANNFEDQNRSSNSIEVIEWQFPNLTDKSIQTSKQEVMEQVLDGLHFTNLALGTNYRLERIHFSPHDRSTNRVYRGLISRLIRHYHAGNLFDET